MFPYQSPFTNGFQQPFPYPPAQQNSQYQQGLMQQQQGIDEIKWVNGIESARQYNMPANSRAILMDSNKDIIYIKQTDASGLGTVSAYSFVPLDLSNQGNNGIEDIRQEVSDLRDKISAIEKEIKNEQHTGQQQSKSRTKSNSSKRNEYEYEECAN